MSNHEKNFLRAAAREPLSVLQQAYTSPSLTRAVNAKGWNALMLAADSGDEHKVRWLASICDPDFSARNGEAALTIAARRGALGCVNILAPISKRTIQGTHGHTPLQAALNSNEECALAILKCMSDEELKYEFKRQSAHHCASQAKFKALEHFERAGLTDATLLRQAFIQFCQHDNSVEAAKRYAKLSESEKLDALRGASHAAFSSDTKNTRHVYLMEELSKFDSETAAQSWKSFFIDSFQGASPELIQELSRKFTGEFTKEESVGVARDAFERLDSAIINIAAKRCDVDSMNQGFVECVLYTLDTEMDSTKAGQAWLHRLFQEGVNLVDFETCHPLDYQTSESGRSIATQLARCGYGDSLRVALEYCSPDGFDLLHDTPLMAAAQAGHSDCVKALLEVCDPLATRKDYGSKTKDAEDDAVDNGHASIALEIRAAKKEKLREIMNAEVREDEAPSTKLGETPAPPKLGVGEFEAFATLMRREMGELKATVAKMAQMLKERDIAVDTPEGSSPTEARISPSKQNPGPTIQRRFEWQEAHPNKIGSYNRMWVAAMGPGRKHDVAEALRIGANPNAMFDKHSRCLHKALEHRSPKSLELVQMLLEAGAEPNISNYIGATALSLAINSDEALNASKLLLSYGANPVGKIPLKPGEMGNDFSPLEACALSIHHDSPKILKEIIEAARDKGEAYQWSLDRALLSLSIQDQQSPYAGEKAKMLLEAGANPLIQDWSGQTPTTWAKSKRNLALTLVFERHLAAKAVSLVHAKPPIG